MNIQTITYHVVDSFDFDEFVLAYYNKSYDFAAVVESSNDTDHSFSTGTWTKEINSAGVANWLNGESDFLWPDVILSDLADKGVIPSGKYLIKVSW